MVSGLLWFLIDPFGLVSEPGDTVSAIVGYVFDLLEQMLAPPACALVDAFEALDEALGVAGVFGAVSPWLTAANAWFPVTESMAIVAAYLTFVSVFSVVKIIVKLVPTIG